MLTICRLLERSNGHARWSVRVLRGSVLFCSKKSEKRMAAAQRCCFFRPESSNDPESLAAHSTLLGGGEKVEIIDRHVWSKNNMWTSDQTRNA